MWPTPHQLCTFTDGDVTLSYEIHGKGDRPLVFMHGLLFDSLVNRRLAHDLAQAGNRVILLDLPGHGRSDKPLRISSHHTDTYVHHVLRLLDELNIETAAIGGTSLGADVTLLLALTAPQRVRAMVLEMPVLEKGTPVAAFTFTPLMFAAHYAAPVIRATSTLAKRIPRERMGLVGTVISPLIIGPAELTALLGGVGSDQVVPRAEQRAQITAPALVIGNRGGWLHPMEDATKLSKELPNARLVEARSILELRTRPARITSEIVSFLDDAWAESARGTRSA